MVEDRSKELLEVVRQILIALDDIEFDLKALGRHPVNISAARDALTQIEFRLMSDTFHSDSTL